MKKLRCAVLRPQRQNYPVWVCRSPAGSLPDSCEGYSRSRCVPVLRAASARFDSRTSVTSPIPRRCWFGRRLEADWFYLESAVWANRRLQLGTSDISRYSDARHSTGATHYQLQYDDRPSFQRQKTAKLTNIEWRKVRAPRRNEGGYSSSASVAREPDRAAHQQALSQVSSDSFSTKVISSPGRHCQFPCKFNTNSSGTYQEHGRAPWW